MRELSQKSRDTAANIALYAGFWLVQLAWVPVVLMLYGRLSRHALFPQLAARSLRPLDWAALVVLEDLAFYCFHRSSHALGVLWASHVTHHSSRHFNPSVALRQTWTPFLGAVFWLPLAWIGFDGIAIVTVQGSSLLFQACLHLPRAGSLGWLGWLLNTPSHHRVHHATQPHYLNRNFGGVFILWDRLFGSFEPEDPAFPPVYGIHPQLESHNPLQIALHGWLDLFRGRSRAHFTSVALAGVLSLLTGCRGALEDYAFNRAYTRLSALEGYEGRLVETGMLNSAKEGELVSRVRYRKPDHYWVETEKPARLKGNQLVFTGTELWLRFPHESFAIHWKNLPRLNEDEREVLARNRFRRSIELYDWEQNGPGGLTWVAQAKDSGSLIEREISRVEGEHFLPVEGNLEMRNGARYGFRFEEVAFNPNADAAEPVPRGLPYLSEWD